MTTPAQLRELLAAAKADGETFATGIAEKALDALDAAEARAEAGEAALTSVRSEALVLLRRALRAEAALVDAQVLIRRIAEEGMPGCDAQWLAQHGVGGVDDIEARALGEGKVTG